MNGSIFYVIKEIIKKSVKQNWSNYRTLGNSWNYFFKTTVYIVYSYTLLPSLKIINEITNELKKTINEMVGIFQVRILWLAIFQGGIFQEEVWWVVNFRAGIPPGGFSYKDFLHIMYLFLFFKKIINKYIKTFSKKIYTLNS